MCRIHGVAANFSPSEVLTKKTIKNDFKEKFFGDDFTHCFI
jgi:hypothetical protein